MHLPAFAERLVQVVKISMPDGECLKEPQRYLRLFFILL